MKLTTAPADNPDDRLGNNGRSNLSGRFNFIGARDLGPQVRQAVDRPIVTLTPDSPAIRAIAITKGRGGESDVIENATHEFGAANNQLKEELYAVLLVLSLQLKGVRRRLRCISQSMERIDPYVRSTHQGSPWTLISRIKVGFFIALSLVLLAVGLNSTATVLHSSGIRMFEYLPAAYLFSTIPLTLPAALKGAATFISHPDRRRNYIVLIWGLGLFFGTLWAAYFARIFPALAQTPADIVRSLTESGAPGWTGASNNTFVFLGIMAETFLAAGCWLTAQVIAEKHQLDHHRDNPSHVRLQSDCDRWTKIFNEYSTFQGQLQGKLQSMSDEQRSYIGKCVNIFHAALKNSEDNQSLGDFLNG